jgi:hypothetical protein
LKNRLIAIGACALFAPAAFAGLPAGLSGTWYDPAHSGHGVHLGMLSGDAASGAWNVFDAQGRPLHLYFEGRVENGRLVANAYAPGGMPFGTFDRSTFSAPLWGSLVFDFSDCDHALLSYAGDGPAGAGYGHGTVPLTRLASLAGLGCDFRGNPAPPVAGAYEGTFARPGSDPGDPPFVLHAAIDVSGRFWATTGWTPGHKYVSAVGYPPVFTASPPAATPGGLKSVAVVRYNTAFAADDRMDEHRGPMLMTLDYRASASGVGTVAGDSTAVPDLATRVSVSEQPGVLADAGFNVASLRARRFRFMEKSQFGDLAREIVFGGNYLPHSMPSSICIVDRTTPWACELAGTILATDQGLAMFDFVLQGNQAIARTYHGKGWLRGDTGELAMVAEGDDVGFGIVARPAAP